MITKDEASDLQSLIDSALHRTHDLETAQKCADEAKWMLQNFLDKLQQPAALAPRKSRAKVKAA